MATKKPQSTIEWLERLEIPFQVVDGQPLIQRVAVNVVLDSWPVHMEWRHSKACGDYTCLWVYVMATGHWKLVANYPGHGSLPGLEDTILKLITRPAFTVRGAECGPPDRHFDVGAAMAKYEELVGEKRLDETCRAAQGFLDTLLGDDET